MRAHSTVTAEKRYTGYTKNPVSHVNMYCNHVYTAFAPQPMPEASEPTHTPSNDHGLNGMTPAVSGSTYQCLLSQLRRRLSLLPPLLAPLLVPRHPQRQVLRGCGHVDLVVVADGIRRPPILARHPALDIRRLPADLIHIGVDYDRCACAELDQAAIPAPQGRFKPMSWYARAGTCS